MNATKMYIFFGSMLNIVHEIYKMLILRQIKFERRAFAEEGCPKHRAEASLFERCIYVHEDERKKQAGSA